MRMSVALLCLDGLPRERGIANTEGKQHQYKKPMDPLGDQLVRSYYGAWPAWPRPAWIPQAPAFVYYDGSAYPPSMDGCVQTYLPTCSRMYDGEMLVQCTNAVFARCKDRTLNLTSVYEPYSGT